MSIDFKSKTFANVNLVDTTTKDQLNNLCDEIQTKLEMVPKLLDITHAIANSNPNRAIAGLEGITNIDTVLGISTEELENIPVLRKLDIYNTNINEKLDSIKEEIHNTQRGILGEIVDILSGYANNTVEQFTAAMEGKVITEETCNTLIDKVMPSNSVLDKKDFIDKYGYIQSRLGYILSTMQYSHVRHGNTPTEAFNLASFIEGMPAITPIELDEDDKAMFMEPVKTKSDFVTAGWTGKSLESLYDKQLMHSATLCERTIDWVQHNTPYLERDNYFLNATPMLVTLKNLVNGYIHTEKCLMSMFYNMFN